MTTRVPAFFSGLDRLTTVVLVPTFVISIVHVFQNFEPFSTWLSYPKDLNFS